MNPANHYVKHSRNHAALEHFIGDGTGDAVVAFSPSTYRRIIFLANSRQRVNWTLINREQRGFRAKTRALSVSGAIFLILEMNRPYEGMIQISSTPMRNALL